LGRRVVAWIVLLVCAAAPSGADDVEDSGPVRIFEPDTPIQIRADSMEYESGRDLYVAIGGVVIRQEDREMRAEWMAFSNSTRRGVASGEVVYTDGVDTVRTRFVEFDIDTLEGVMFDAEFDAESYQMELRGAEVAKTGDRPYAFKDGEFTTCRCPDPEAREPWQLTAEKADLEVEGYGTARNTTLEVLGVPVTWLPWMIYPLKTKRQSGLLFPDVSLTGRNGVEIGLPIFWAVADPVNLIFTPRWLSKRGFKGDVDVEYVAGEHSGGNLFGAFIYDQDVDPGSRRTPFDKERWGTRGYHDFFLADEVRFKTKYAFVSDNSYPNDFEDHSRYRQDRFLPSRAFLERGWGGADVFGGLVGVQYMDDLQNPDDTDRDDFLLQRLPEARFDLLPVAMPFAQWIAPALGFQYAWYQQADLPQDVYSDDRLETSDGRFYDTGIDGIPNSVEQGRDGSSTPPDPNFDDSDVLDPVNGSLTGTEGDELFQEGELLADSGHRAVLTPRLGLPFRFFDALEFYPEVGWHETVYQSDAQGFERHGFFTGRADLGMRLRGRFGEVSHLLEPRVGWAYAQDTRDRSDPLYVPPTAVPQQGPTASRSSTSRPCPSATRSTAGRKKRRAGCTCSPTSRSRPPTTWTGATSATSTSTAGPIRSAAPRPASTWDSIPRRPRWTRRY
jgi:lipopolysaccharide assembly outer membrane protein LptD (OstA)